MNSKTFNAAWRLARRVCGHRLDEADCYRQAMKEFGRYLTADESAVAFRCISARTFNNEDMHWQRQRLAYARVDAMGRTP